MQEHFISKGSHNKLGVDIKFRGEFPAKASGVDSLSFEELIEALKHSFFFRGFFKRRGYYNLAQLRPDQYRHDKIFANPRNHREWFTGDDLFQLGSNGLEMLSPSGERCIDAVAAQLGDSLAARPIVVEGYSTAQDHDQQFALARNRAIVVSQYLRAHFHLDMQDIGIVSLMGLPPAGLSKDKWDGICIVILK